MRRALLVLLVGLLPVAAAAQFLDFDGACASPPCNAGSLYAASGVTFSPATTQVVNAGTNSLAGPSGGKYLSVATFPYTLTITLARPATFVTMRLARAAASSGPVTVTVTALKAGVTLATTSVVLDNVNIWVPVSLLRIAGFDSIFLDAVGGANLTFGVDAIQVGGTCFGFSDVSPSDNFCNATEWIANRGVTLGCATAQYCPLANVSRAQMALFMQRLGTALAPKNFGGSCGHSGDYQTPAVGCVQSIGTGTTHRSVMLNAACTLTSFGARKRVRMRIVASTDGGLTWTAADFAKYATGDVGDGVSVASNTLHGTGPGIDYRYGIELVHDNGAAAEALNGICNLTAQTVDVAGTIAPFDADPPLPDR